MAIKVDRYTAAMFLLEVAIIIMYGVFVEYDDAVEASGSSRRAGGEDAGDVSGSNSTVDHYYPFFQDVHVMIFIGFGFLMTFLRRYGFSAVGLNLLLGAFAIQWSILVLGFWHRVFSDHLDFDHSISLDITTLIVGDFAAGAVLITFGALLGKAEPMQMLIIAALEIVFYALNESICVEEFKAVDMGGSMYVHTFGAYFGLGCAYMLTKEDAKNNPANGSSYTSDMFAMIGTLFLWMFWPSFNGALASSIGNSQHRVIINTVLSLTASCISGFFASRQLRPEHKFDMVDVQNATLAGGVAVGSSADLVIGPLGSMLIGFLAGYLSVIGYVYIQPFLEKKFGLHDTCGVHNLHGLPGVMGGIGGAISAASAGDEAYGDSIGDIFPARAADDDNRSAGEQGAYQIYALLLTLTIAISSGALTGVIASKVEEPREHKKPYHDDVFWEVPHDYSAVELENKAKA